MVKLGIMSFAHMHAGGYASACREIPNAELVGIADDDAARGRQMAERFQTRYFDSYDELLEQDIAGVIVTPENVRHRELTVLAAQAGKHVMCEKPLAPTAADCRAMIEVCRRSGVKLQTAFPCRYSPAMQRAKQAIESGQTGRILAIKGTNHGMCPGGWFIDRKLSGGGAVMDHTVHVVDLMRWVLKSEVSEVYAETSNLMFHQDFEDIGILTLQFKDGTFATIDSSWSRPKSFPFWGDVTMEIVGTDGVISLDLFDQKIDVYSDATMRVSWNYWGSSPDLGLVAAFVRSIEQDSPVEVSGEDGLAATEVVEAAYRSAETGEPVGIG